MSLPSWIHHTLAEMLQFWERPWSVVNLPLSSCDLRLKCPFHVKDAVQWSKKMLRPIFPTALPQDLYVVDFTVWKIGHQSSLNQFVDWMQLIAKHDYGAQKRPDVSLFRMVGSYASQEYKDLVGNTAPNKLKNVWNFVVQEPNGVTAGLRSHRGSTILDMCNKLRSDEWYVRACIPLQIGELARFPDVVETRWVILHRNVNYQKNIATIVSGVLLNTPLAWRAEPQPE